MKILVCMSVVPDTTTKISFTDNDTKMNKQGVQFILNPYDELSITKALELTESIGGTVTVIHVGPAENDAVIRKALALGANNAIRINGEATDGQFVAEQIAKYASSQSYDLIMTGRESIDYNGGQVCGLLGELLDLPSVNVVSTIEIKENTATLSRDIDGGKEFLTCTLPLVMSAQKDLCEPRIPNMKGIMAARTKPLEVIESSDNQSYTSYSRYESPQAKSAVKLINSDNPSELFDLLKREAKVL